MIQVRDNRGNYHEALAIYDNAGREIKEIRDNQGRLLFKNWNEIHGSVPLSFMSRGGYLKDYRIYGNTVQNGTPTPENPVEVRGCGEYDAELNGYKIPVTVSNGTNSITTPVYIGSEPLHKIGGYADYVDFKRGVVMRRIRKATLTWNEQFSGPYTNSYRIYFAITFSDILATTNQVLVYNSHFIVNKSSQDTVNMKDAHTCRNGHNTSIVWFFIPRAWFSGEISAENCKRELQAFFANQYSAGTPVTIWYVLKTPKKEPLENLLPIQTIKGSDVLTAGTAVQPSEIYIKGKIKSIT